MASRNGREFIEHLRNHPREVWVNGERVDDVTTHPAFAASVEQLAGMYEMQHAPETRDKLTYVVPETGERASLAFKAAHTVDDLWERGEAFRLWSEKSFGLMGRSPDFMNVLLLALWESRHILGEAGEQYADNVDKYYRYIRDNDLFLSHALISPQNDRSKSSSEQAQLHMRVTRETDDGIYINGARMIATLGPVADELLMFSLPGLKPGDEDHALVFAVPTDVEGLRQISRKPYALQGERSSFDHPLSSRFEENDSLLVFKDVFVPWERVFLYRNVDLSNRLYPETAIRNYTAQQSNMRALVKMQFAVGVAVEVARSIKADQFPQVQYKLGDCLNSVEIVKSGLVRSVVEAERTECGSLRPSLAPLQTLRTFLPKAYPAVVEAIQTIAAGGVMMMPSGADLTVPELREDAELYYQGAGISSVDRVRLFKLAWDLVGEAFGMRTLQYERYYAGDPYRIMMGNYMAADVGDLTRLVDSALELAGDPVHPSQDEPAVLSA